jgi:hypothetical protein
LADALLETILHFLDAIDAAAPVADRRAIVTWDGAEKLA